MNTAILACVLTCQFFFTWIYSFCRLGPSQSPAPGTKVSLRNDLLTDTATFTTDEVLFWTHNHHCQIHYYHFIDRLKFVFRPTFGLELLVRLKV